MRTPSPEGGRRRRAKSANGQGSVYQRPDGLWTGAQRELTVEQSKKLLKLAEAD